MQALKYILGSSGFALIFLGACGERLGLIVGLGGSGCLLLAGALAVRELQARRAAAKWRELRGERDGIAKRDA